ncbi:MAG: endonuclease/exonuclease/phosphatase family protein [Candidatus Spechtbacterales bacterium]
MWKLAIRNTHIGVAVFLVGATLMMLAAPLGWPFELASHFPLHIAFLGVAVMVWCARKPAGEAVLLCLMAVSFNIAIAVPVFMEQEIVAPPGDIRVVTANVLYRSDDYGAMVELIAKENPDIVIIVEETPAWREGLSPLSASYAYQEHSGATARVRGMSGVGVYSKTPLSVLSLENVPYRDERPALAVATVLGEEEVTFVAVHPWTPATPGTYAKRNAQLAALADFTATRSGEALMVGDMNITPQSPDFEPLLASYGLRSARAGRGWAPSWPAPLGWLGIPIDHAFHTAGIVVSDFRMGPFVGSDHYPTIVDFSVEVDAL